MPRCRMLEESRAVMVCAHASRTFDSGGTFAKTNCPAAVESLFDMSRTSKCLIPPSRLQAVTLQAADKLERSTMGIRSHPKSCSSCRPPRPQAAETSACATAFIGSC